MGPTLWAVLESNRLFKETYYEVSNSNLLYGLILQPQSILFSTVFKSNYADGGPGTTIRTKNVPHQLPVENHFAILQNHSRPFTVVYDLPQQGVSFIKSDCPKVLEFNIRFIPSKEVWLLRSIAFN